MYFFAQLDLLRDVVYIVKKLKQDLSPTLYFDLALESSPQGYVYVYSSTLYAHTLYFFIQHLLVKSGVVGSAKVVQAVHVKREREREKEIDLHPEVNFFL